MGQPLDSSEAPLSAELLTESHLLLGRLDDLIRDLADYTVSLREHIDAEHWGDDA